MNLDVILPVFLARLIGGYAICLGLFGPLVSQGSWRKVSLFVMAVYRPEIVAPFFTSMLLQKLLNQFANPISKPSPLPPCVAKMAALFSRPDHA